MDYKYSVESYFGADHNGHPVGLEEAFETDDWSKVEENAHEKLSGGSHVKILDNETGNSIEIRPDMYLEDFNGEFPYKPQDLENDEQTRYEYQLLDRLKTDCKYVLDTEIGENGISLETAQNKLWAKNPEDQIAKMRELYATVPTKPDWLTEADIDNFEKRFQDISDKEHGYPTREEAIQYALNQGTGIVNYYDTPVAELETAETTQAERDAAARTGHEPREVSAETVEFFYQGAKEDDAILYAVQNNMDLLDLDEWQAIREATGLPLSKEDAQKINNILYEGYDFTPLDIQPDAAATNVKAAILDELSTADEAQIYGVLSHYETNHLAPERDTEAIRDNLEQFMFERGEYDFGESDRIRWLDGVPEPYDLAGDPAALQEARSTVSKNIEEAMKSGAGIEAIQNYLKDQWAEMDSEDENVQKAEGLGIALEDYKVSTLNDYMQAKTAGELENATGYISLEDAERLKETFDIVPMYDHLENTYGDAGYEVVDGLETNEVVNVVVRISDYDDFMANEDELNDLADEYANSVKDCLGGVEPMLAIDKGGNEAVIPLYRSLKEGKLLTAEDIEKAVQELIPDTEEVTTYGTKNLSTGEYPERKELADVELRLDPVDYLLKETRNCVNEVRDSYRKEKDTELIYDMIEAVNCSVKENAAGTYDVVDGMTGEYRAIDCEDLTQVLDSLDTLIDNNLLDYMANELYQSKESSEWKDVDVPRTAEEWIASKDNPALAEFIEGHKTEYQEIELLANPDRIKAASIANVAYTFSPEDREYTAFGLNNLYNEEDKTIFLHGDKYTASPEAQKVFAEISYSSLYKIELNDTDYTFNVHDTDDLREAKRQEMSEVLAEFMNSEGFELDLVEDNGWHKFVIYDKELGDYRKDENGKPEAMTSAEKAVTNLSSVIGEVQSQLEDAFEEAFGDADKDMPNNAAEWVSFAGRRGNEDFAKDYKSELDVMCLAHEPDAPSISDTYRIQNEREERAKGKNQPEKNNKKVEKDL